ncbi:MAG: type II toxin-antitoxin system prevent-host-death family antitoxin [bacterium]|nr:type II toxin-antitoxin system prevent-host-death family antitoxin [bacterium]
MSHNLPSVALSIEDARIVERLQSGHENVVLEQDGAPVAVILSIEEYEALTSERRSQARKRWETGVSTFGKEIGERGLTEEDIEAAVERVRQELHDQRHGR